MDEVVSQSSARLAAMEPLPGLPVKSPRLRLTYLDGLRGLAALYVVLFHASQIAHGYAIGAYNANGGWTPQWMWLQALIKAAQFMVLNYGHYAVVIFIVLSGYCLMLPVARAKQDHLRDGFGTFIKRRAWRILPPYYAALALSLLFIAVVPGMRTNEEVYWNSALPAFGPMTLLTHVLLIHNWGPWAMKINQPMWSIALEWQIYFLFPLMILPLRRWLGSLATVIITFALGVVVVQVLSRHIDVAWSNAWFLGLFAMGVFAASVGFSGRERETRWNHRLPWLKIEFVLWVAAILLTVVQRKSWENVSWLWWARVSTWGSPWPLDFLIGLATTCLIIRLTRQVTGDDPTPKRGALRVFESWPAVKLGEFSYSLYLVHSPIVCWVDMVGRRLGFGPAGISLSMFVVALPVSLVVGYLFHLVFELPFMRTGPRRTTPLASAEVTPLVLSAPLPVGALSRVSVIIPCHDAAGYLARGVASVLNQTYSNVEVIVVDDASSDDPPKVLESFGDRVTYLRSDRNLGPSGTRNLGIARATGQVLAFLDADDWWPADLLERLVPFVARGSAVCYDNFLVPESNLSDETAMKPTAETLLSEWLSRGPNIVTRDNMHAVLTTPALFKVLADRSDCECIGGFDARYRCGEDMHFCLKLAAAGVRLNVVADPKGFYLVRGDSILRTIQKSSDRNVQALHGWWHMFSELPVEQPLSPEAVTHCRRLRDYYRGRYADALIKTNLAARDFRGMLSASFLKTVVPAFPAIVQFKAKGAAGRLRRRVESLTRAATAGATAMSKVAGGSSL